MLTLERELAIDKSADEVWDWMSDFRNAMTINQFHEYVDCDPADVKEPKPGLVVPIMHNLLGFQQYRLGRITKYEDYSIAWGERVPEGHDVFPHSEGWTVVATAKNQCVLHTHLRASWTTPIGKLIGPYIWNTMMPSLLDNDLQDVALAVGAIEKKRQIEMPASSAPLLRLAMAQTIDGVPADECLGSVPPLTLKHPN